MTTPEQLAAFTPTKSKFIGIDSDGCAFDSMEIKWKECFIPCAIEHMGLQPVSRFARQCIEFVNLYSQSRGTNRFFGLIESLDWLEQMDQVKARGFAAPALTRVRQLCKDDPQPTNGKLQTIIDETGDEGAKQTMAWSNAVNDTVKRLVHGVPPFPLLKESLERLSQEADILVVSSTPVEALEREWEEHGIAKYITHICGQETGSKKQVLSQAAASYDRDSVLMIGDAPGDQKAADAVSCRFYPIVPGAEEVSWERFHNEAIDRFLAGTYAGAYEQELVTAFNAGLPSRPDFL